MEQQTPNGFQPLVPAPDPMVNQMLQGPQAMPEKPVLVLHSPQIIGQQALRSIVYDFNGNLKDRIYSGIKDRDNGRYYLNPNEMCPDVIKAVQVAADCVPLDTMPIEQNWTFMLIMKGGSHDMRYVPGQNTTVAIGYVMSPDGDAPVSPYGAVNQNAVLVFTHCVSGNGIQSYSQTGGGTSLMAFGTDATGYAVAPASKDSLYVATPRDLLSIGLGIDSNGNNVSPETVDFLKGAHCVSIQNNENCPVGYKSDVSLRSPQEHLRTVANAVGSGTILSRNVAIDVNTEMGFPRSAIPTQLGAYHESVLSNIAAGTYCPSIGFNFNEVHTIGEIMTNLHADVKVVNLLDHPDHGVTMQAMVHPRLTASAFIMASTTAFMVKHGLLEVEFIWRGWSADPFGVHAGENTDFQMLGSGPVVQMDAASLNKIHAEFEMFWRLSIRPMLDLLGNGSQCYVSAHISTVNESIVDVQYYDDRSTIDDGFYTVSPNLSALFNPNVYDIKTFSANADQIANLTDNIGNKVSLDIVQDAQTPVGLPLDTPLNHQTVSPEVINPFS